MSCGCAVAGGRKQKSSRGHLSRGRERMRPASWDSRPETGGLQQRGRSLTVFSGGTTPTKRSKACRSTRIGAGALRQPHCRDADLDIVVVRAGQSWKREKCRALRRAQSVPAADRRVCARDSATDAEAAQDGAPVPSERVIKRIEWAPRDTILREAKGSDNWPLTWADDDAAFTPLMAMALDSSRSSWRSEPWVAKITAPRTTSPA